MRDGNLSPQAEARRPAWLLATLAPLSFGSNERSRSQPNIVENLRDLVLAPPLQRERCHVVFLDDRRQVLGSASVGIGKRDALSFSMRELFQRALAIEARSMIIAHSHPSGGWRPSANDLESTRRIHEIAMSLCIELIDHLIFTQSHVYSIRKGSLL